MEFRILGPLEVVSEKGDRLDLGRPQQRLLLGMLLLDANRVVSPDSLIEGLWGEHAPRTARHTLQTHVYRLRRLLEAGGQPRILLARDGGYLLETDQIDVLTFERLVAQGREDLRRERPREAAGHLNSALSLWRDRPLVDLDLPARRTGRLSRLEELYLGASEDRIEADLLLGRSSQVVAELESLVLDHPLRERFWEQLMLALFRSGRQGDALRAFQRARRVLAEELGLEPGPALGRLEAQILAHDPDLVRDAGGGRGGPFVGRSEELLRIREVIEEARAGKGGWILVSGEEGIGKTKLVEQAALLAASRGLGVVRARCWEAGGAPPYFLWTGVLRSCLERIESEAEQTALRDRLGVLIDVEDSALPAGSRFALFEAATSVLRMASEDPLLIVLEDLHGADEPSLQLLRFVVDRLAHVSCLLLGTSREFGTLAGERVGNLLADLSRASSADRIRLRGLNENEVAELVEAIVRVRPSAGLVTTLHRRTEGNPLFLGDVIRHLAAEASLIDEEGVENLPLPPGLREAVRSRLDGLSGETRRLVTLASVAGDRLSSDLVEIVGGTPDQVLAHLSQAVGAGVLTEDPSSRTYRFTHGVVRDVLYRELAPDRRIVLHRVVAKALQREHGKDPEHLSEIAHHLLEAAVDGETEEACRFARGAADLAMDRLAYEEAARLYRRAAQIVHGPGSERLRCGLLLSVGDALTRAGDLVTGREAYQEAAHLARLNDLPDELGMAALGYGGRFLWVRGGSDPAVIPLLEEALDQIGGRNLSLRAELLARLAGALRDEPRPERSREASEEAVVTARNSGDAQALTYALVSRAAALWDPGNAHERSEITAEVIELADRLNDVDRAMEGRHLRFVARLELGDVLGARLELERKAELAERTRQPVHRWLVCVSRGVLALMKGDLASADGLAAEARELGRLAEPWDAEVVWQVQRFMVAREQGELEELEEVLVQNAARYPSYPMLEAMLAVLYTETGRRSEAERLLEGRVGATEVDLPYDNQWLFGLSLLTDAVAELGNEIRAATLYGALAVQDARNVVAPPAASLGSAERSLGVLAGLVEQWEQAERHFSNALEMNEVMGAVLWAAHTRAGWARMLAMRARRQDAERAWRLLEGAIHGYQSCGATHSASRAEEMLAAIG